MMRYINFYTISLLFILSCIYIISPFFLKLNLDRQIYLSFIILFGVIIIRLLFNNTENFENNVLLDAYKTLNKSKDLKIFTPNNKPIILNKNNNKDYKALILSNNQNYSLDQPQLKEKSFNALIHPPNTESFFVPDENGFFDIGNANTQKYISGDVGALKTIENNYSIELWIKPQFFGNQYIMSFSDGVKRTMKKEINKKLIEVPIQYLSILIDESSIYIENDSIENRVPYTPGEWIQLVLKRGEPDEIGSNFGKIYKNGVYLRNTNNALPLNVIKEGGWIFFQNPSKLGLTHNQYLNSNPDYNNNSCFSICRIYNRALEDTEILQNYNFNAYQYNLTAIPGIPYINDSLICNLDATDRNSYPGVGSIWYDISPIKNMKETKLNNPTILIKNVHTKKNIKCPSKKIEEAKKSIIQEEVKKPIIQEEAEETQKPIIQEEAEEVQKNVSKKQNDKNLGQILNKNKLTVGIVDANKNIQMLEHPIKNIAGLPIIGIYNEKVNNSGNFTRNDSWLNFE
jgi:hypothetical protein